MCNKIHNCVDMCVCVNHMKRTYNWLNKSRYDKKFNVFGGGICVQNINNEFY